MATNNYWDLVQGKVVQQPQPPAPNPSFPRIIILDPFAESVNEYALNFNDLTALETIYIVANKTAVSFVTIYVPTLPTTPLARKITIVNNGLNLVQVENAVGTAINWDTSYIINLDPYTAPATPNTTTAVTLICDTQVSPSWYTIGNYYNQ